MTKIRFETGQVVNFDGTPTKKDIEEISQKFSIKSKSFAGSKNPFLPGEAKTQKLISERIDPVETLRKEAEVPFDFSTPKKAFKSALKPFVTTAKISSVITGRPLAAVGGLLKGIQKPGTGFKEIGKMAKAGFTGEKQFRALDFARASGLPSFVATGGELGIEIAVPLKILSGVNKILRGPIQKMSDLKLLKIGKDLTKSADDAVTAVSKPLTKAYQPINSVGVDANPVLDKVAKLPKSVIRHLEEELGQGIDEIRSNFNIEKARKLKGILGKLKPNVFGKEVRGLEDTILDAKVNRAYASIKKSMQEALESQGLKKEASKLLGADEAFEETINASRFVKKTITDPTLREPTRIGRAASGLEKEADLTFRRAVNTLRKSGFRIRQRINKSVEGLESFNRSQQIKKLTGQVGQSVLRGAVVGGTVGKILGANRQDDFGGGTEGGGR